MSAKPYTQTQPSSKPNRNVFDLSHSNNLSLKFGNLYPVLCQEVIPGDTFQIDATFGLRFMPLVFPVQTRMRADLHFFYVRNRNLWKNWKKFFSRTSKSPLQLPYIKKAPGDFWKIGGLADYLGIPVSYVGSETLSNFFNELPAGDSKFTVLYKQMDGNIVSAEFVRFVSPQWYFHNQNLGRSLVAGNSFAPQSDTTEFGFDTYATNYLVTKLPVTTLGQGNTLFSGNSFNLSISGGNMTFSEDADSENNKKAVLLFVRNGKIYATWKVALEGDNTLLHIYSNSSAYKVGDIVTENFVWEKSPIEFMNDTYARSLDNPIDVYVSLDTSLFMPFKDTTLPIDAPISQALHYRFTFDYTNNGIVDLKDLPLSQNPFASVGKTAPQIPISALPFRAYEAIYNSFYRDQINDPFIKNGSPEYDEYITTDADGADATNYHLFQRNWEQDVFTTAMPSPQQGIAPLLGVSSPNGLNATQQFVMNFTSEDGTAGSIKINNDNGALSFVGEDDANIQGALQTLNNAVNFGISINDLRNVNALQKWLEKAVRNGFRYKDQMESHFGIEIGLKELAIPEYIGGVSKDIDVNVITQQEPAINQHGFTDVLGHQAGIGTALGSPKHSVSNYCDEHGFIIGILSIIPIPTYSQHLPKHFTKFEPLDFYSPEFSHIGPQPIPIKELTPLQVVNGKYDKVFGYQRAWYDYFSNIDTVHGQFRSTLKDYLVNRTFQTPPELSHDFLVVKNEDVNDIFAVNNEDEDNIVGQIYFDIRAVRPLAKYGTPSIE